MTIFSADYNIEKAQIIHCFFPAQLKSGNVNMGKCTIICKIQIITCMLRLMMGVLNVTTSMALQR